MKAEGKKVKNTGVKPYLTLEGKVASLLGLAINAVDTFFFLAFFEGRKYALI